jgi:pyruvate dehydrogenase E2 component (dihydrolipoamide acetyltransferase)
VATLPGTGRNGRVRERDVAAALGAPTKNAIPVTPIRRAIAARMSESARTTAPVTLTTLVDATNLIALRTRLKTEGDPVPSYTDLLVKLVAHALRKHPLLTARWADDFLRPADRLDIGVAVETDAGLLVPVVRDVPALGLRQLAARTRDLIDRARAGKLAVREMEGGCFTVTNLGAYGIDAFTPIINLPECAILGVGRIAERPAVVGGAVVPRDQVTLSLTFDHRVIDGGPAARFLQTLTEMIESPEPWCRSEG